MDQFEQRRHLPILASAFATFLLFANSAHSQNSFDAISHGPKIGAAIGAALAGSIDQDGKRQNLKSLSGKNGLILLISRSLQLVTLLHFPSGRLEQKSEQV